MERKYAGWLFLGLSLCTAACGAQQAARPRGPEQPVPSAQSRPASDRDPELQRIRELLTEAARLAQLGNHQGARSLIRDAWKATKALPDADSRKDVQDLRFRIGKAAYDTGDLKAAQVAWEAVTAFRERTFSDEHPDLQKVRGNLGVTKYQLGDLHGAQALLEQVLAVSLRTQTEEHIDVQKARLNLATIRHARGDSVAARTLYERAHDVLMRTVSAEDTNLQAARMGLAVTKKALGDLRGALTLHEQVVAVLIRTVPDEDQGLQLARANLALTMFELGDLAGARAHQEGVLAVATRTLTEDHPALQDARSCLAGTLHALGDLATARRLFEQVLANRIRILPEEHSDVLMARANLAVVQKELGDLAGALAVEERVHAILASTRQDEDADLRKIRVNLAVTNHALGRLPEARALQERVVASCARALPDDHPDLQAARAGLAATMADMGELREALTLREQVVAVRSRTLPEEHRDLQGARLNLASSRKALGDLAEARAMEEQALAVLTRTLPDYHPDLQKARSNLAHTRYELGDLGEARRLQEQVLRAYAGVPEDHPDLQSARLGLARTKKAFGDLVGAQALEEEVFAVETRTLPEEHPHLQVTRSNLAATKCMLGDYAGALALQERVLAVRMRALPEVHPDVQWARLNLGATRLTLGDHIGARGLFEQALAAYARTLPQEHPDLQRARANLAAVRADLGDRAGALALQEQILTARARTLPDDHPDLQLARANLAGTLWDLGRASEANELMLRAARGIERRLETVAATFSRRAHIEANRGVATFLSGFLSLHAANASAHAAEDLTVLLRFRGLVDRHARRREALARAAEQDPSLRDRITEAQRAERKFQVALASVNVDLRRDLPASCRAMEALQEDVARAAAALPDVRSASPPCNLAAIARHLPQDAAAIVTASYTRFWPWHGGPKRRPEPVPSITAFVVLPDGSVRRLELGAARQIAAHCMACIRWCSARTHARAPGMSTSEAASSQAMQDAPIELSAALAPLLSALPSGTKTVYVAPDGELASIAWEVLSHNGKALRDRISIRYVDTLAALEPRPFVTAQPALLVAGGIDFDADPVRGVTESRTTPTFPVHGRGHFPPLPGSLREAIAVRDRFVDRFPGRPLRLLTGREASKAAFMAATQRVSIVHLATHAFVAEEATWRLGNNETRPSGSEDSRAEARPGLEVSFSGYARDLLSGIVFAGANGTGQRGGDEAVLTAAELALVDLSHCELAVLSACQTNSGPRHLGEAVTGLNRALQLAGVRYTMTSLWKVDDASTAAFFDAFYQHLWNEQRSVPAAFEAAREDMIKRGLGPGVWAAFVLYVATRGVS